MTDRQPVLYWATNHLLARNDINSSVSVRCFQFSATDVLPKNMTVIETVTCFYKFLKENEFASSDLIERKTDVTAQIKMMSR